MRLELFHFGQFEVVADAVYFECTRSLRLLDGRRLPSQRLLLLLLLLANKYLECYLLHAEDLTVAHLLQYALLLLRWLWALAVGQGHHVDVLSVGKYVVDSVYDHLVEACFYLPFLQQAYLLLRMLPMLAANINVV